MSHETINIDLHMVEHKVRSNGSVDFIITGVTKGKKVKRVVYNIGPGTLGYIGEAVHDALDAYDKMLINARTTASEKETG